MIEAMSSSRRFLLLLLLACVTCVVLVQVTLDGWNLRTSFSYGVHAESKDLQELEIKGVIQLSKAEQKTESTTEAKPKKVTSAKPFTTKSTNLNSAYPRNISHHTSGTAQVRRMPLGKKTSKKLKDKLLVNRQERIQEILKQSNVIRGRSTIDPMKSLKSMPIINPNNVTKIIVLTYFRSGSSFFGDLLQQNWKTFYHFEPLHSMTYNSRIGDDKIEKAFDLFNGIFKCNFSELKDYMQWVKQSHNQFLFAHNLFLRVTCHSNPKTCFNPTFVNAVCSRAPIHVMKLTRLHMRHLKTYLEENRDMEIKVVYLTRDPRGIVSSRWTLDWCNGTECSDPNVLCHEMSEDLKIFDQLQKEKPSNFIKVRYEDITLNPEIESRKLFKFLQLPFSTSVQRFLKTHTVGRRTDDNNPYSTRRNTTSMAFSWRERFTYKQVIDVQQSCEDVLKDLNHSLITAPEQLPFPNGKMKPAVNNSSGSKVSKYNKNPLFLKSQMLNKAQPPEAIGNLKLDTNSSMLQIWNNTNIEIHKTFNISGDSFKNNTRTDYILVKQTVNR